MLMGNKYQVRFLEFLGSFQGVKVYCFRAVQPEAGMSQPVQIFNILFQFPLLELGQK